MARRGKLSPSLHAAQATKLEQNAKLAVSAVSKAVSSRSQRGRKTQHEPSCTRTGKPQTRHVIMSVPSQVMPNSASSLTAALWARRASADGVAAVADADGRRRGIRDAQRHDARKCGGGDAQAGLRRAGLLGITASCSMIQQLQRPFGANAQLCRVVSLSLTLPTSDASPEQATPAHRPLQYLHCRASMDCVVKTGMSKLTWRLQRQGQPDRRGAAGEQAEVRHQQQPRVAPVHE